MTMKLIQTATVGTDSPTSINFLNIPQTFTDLMFVFSLRSNTSSVNQNVYIFFNNDGSGYSGKQGYTIGTSVYSSSPGSEVGQADAASATANTFSNGALYIPNYAGSTQKAYSIDQVVENNGTTNFMGIVGNIWANTAAITQVTFPLGSSYYSQYSSISLYGITKGSGGATVS